MKVGIDSVLLGSWITVEGSEKNVLDIGAGTGLLALMMAQRNPDARIFAVEIDDDACLQASENISSSGWSERITVAHADIKTCTLDYKNFDLIICNPPYFEKSLLSPDSKRNFARHTDTLSFPDLIDCVHRLLNEKGRFALIVPENKAGTIIELAGYKKLFPARRLNVKPTDTKPVNRVIMEFGYLSSPVVEKTLTVRNGNGYSDEYKFLTKDFYL
jgi:tRNA1Val (adenine37-N6)-methyltransferase